MCPRSITSHGGTASKFKTAVGKIADGGPGVQSSLPAVVSFAHTVPGTYGLASIDIVDRGVGVSATSTRGSGVLSTMMSGANIENVNGDGRSQYTGVKLLRGDSGVVGGVHGALCSPPLIRCASPSGESSRGVVGAVGVRGAVCAVALTSKDT